MQAGRLAEKYLAEQARRAKEWPASDFLLTADEAEDTPATTPAEQVVGGIVRNRETKIEPIFTMPQSHHQVSQNIVSCSVDILFANRTVFDFSGEIPEYKVHGDPVRDVVYRLSLPDENRLEKYVEVVPHFWKKVGEPIPFETGLGAYEITFPILGMDVSSEFGSTSGATPSDTPGTLDLFGLERPSRENVRYILESHREYLTDRHYNGLSGYFDSIFEESERGEIELDLMSLRHFLSFLVMHRETRVPAIFITERGNIKAQWQFSISELSWIEFQPSGDVKYLVFFPNTRRSDGVERQMAWSTSDDVWARLASVGAENWMKK